MTVSRAFKSQYRPFYVDFAKRKHTPSQIAELLKEDSDNPSLQEELYVLITQILTSKRFVYLVGYHQDIFDFIHDTYLITLRALKENKLRENNALQCFISGIYLRRLKISFRMIRRLQNIDSFNKDNKEFEIEEKFLDDTIIDEILKEKIKDTAARELTPLQNKIWQIEFENKNQSCFEKIKKLNLSPTSYRLNKSRGKKKIITVLRKKFLVKPRA